MFLNKHFICFQLIRQAYRLNDQYSRKINIKKAKNLWLLSEHLHYYPYLNIQSPILLICFLYLRGTTSAKFRTIERILPVYCVLVSLPDVGHRAPHDMVGSGIHMIVVVSVHGVVHMGRMMQTAECRRPVAHMRFVDTTRRRTIDVPRVDGVIVLQ